MATVAFDHGVFTVIKQIRDSIREQKKAPEKLIAMVEYYADCVINQPILGGCPILNSSIKADDSLPFLKVKVIRTIALIKDSLTKIITRGILEGQIKRETDTEEFAVSLYATIEGAISLSRIEGDGRSYKHVKVFLTKMIEKI